MTSPATSFVRAWAPPPKPAVDEPMAAGIRYFTQGPTANFAAEQIRLLVQQVFIPGWPRPAHQVVFSALDESARSAELCLEVGCELAAKASGHVCIVHTDADDHIRATYGRTAAGPGSVDEQSGEFRKFSRQLSSNLWLIAESSFRQSHHNTVGSLRTLLARLHMDFEYTIFDGAPVLSASDTVLLGSLCDGIVLVLEANRTRRAAALRAKEAILAANARLIGTVLCERDFPIPEGIYRKL